jgi:hypothetical protein
MIELNLPSKLRKALEKEAADAQIGLSAHIIKKLESVTAPIEFLKPEPLHQQLPNLVDFLNRIPAVSVMSSKVTPDAFWWIKLEIDTTHQLAWNVVEHLGFVLNYISLNERLPTACSAASLSEWGRPGNEPGVGYRNKVQLHSS